MNVIVGPNNSGKTTVLEAARLMGRPLDPWNWVDTSRGREIKSGRASRLETLKYLFPQSSPLASSQLFEGNIDLTAEGTAGKINVTANLREMRYEPPEGAVDPDGDVDGEFRRGQVSVEARDSTSVRRVEFEMDRRKEFEPPSAAADVSGPNTRFLSPVHHRVDHGTIRSLSDLLEGGTKQTILGVLRKLDPSVADIIVAVRGGRGPEVRILRNSGGGVPLSSEGDGVRRILALATEAFALVFPYTERPGVLLIDEIETALHISAMGKALELLRLVTAAHKAMNRSVQILATTHSLEVMDAIAEAWNVSPKKDTDLPGPDDVAFFRLPPAGSLAPVVRYSWEEYRERREEAGMDLR
jgi:AAA domain, putative AbiEii toxin, Type IV TA system